MSLAASYPQRLWGNTLGTGRTCVHKTPRSLHTARAESIRRFEWTQPDWEPRVPTARV